MSSRINIARPRDPSGFSNGPSYGSDPHGFSTRAPAYQTSAPANPDDPLEKIRAYGSKVEDMVEIYSQPLKPHLPAIGRFLIVVTFIEDALRITTQWSDQNWYLQKHRHFPWGISHIFLLMNIITMLGASGAIITKRYSEIAVGSLLGVIILQGFGYGLIFDINFFLRNLSVIGGLLMVFSESMVSRKNTFAGIPNLNDNDRRKYFQLTGRVLLIFLFIGVTLQGEWTFARLMFSLVGLSACIMVALGFKAKWSAGFLVVLLSIFNVFVNNWWSVHDKHPQRDFLKYDFFQTLSIVGGLLLLVNMGAGGISVDAKKKF